MYLSIISTLFGILFILSGIAGFIPGLQTNGLLYGVFYVDTIHNVANFVIGLIALFCALRYKSDRLFFQIFGVIFALLAISGFVNQGNLFFTHTNMADTILHIVIAVLFLILGFASNKEGQV